MNDNNEMDLIRTSPETSPEDFIDYVQGTSTADKTKRVQSALNDPDSELNAWLTVLVDWAKDSYPGGRTRRIEIKDRYRSETSDMLNKIVQFIHDKRIANILTEEEVSLIFSVSGFNSKIIPTPAESIAATARITDAIRELHPELAEEVFTLRAERSQKL